jgi:DNA replication and repair protein RecF
MQVRTLRVADLRSVAQAELQLGPRVNVILGPNGAGKTSLIEALYLMSRGRSFRTRRAEVLSRRGSPGFSIFAEVNVAGAQHRLGVGHSQGAWQVRIDEVDAPRLSSLFEWCAACCFEPGSHDLLTGAREDRRAFVDWGVFHMEPRYAVWWRRYQRALRQRNAALKAEASDTEIDAWDQELAEAGEPLSSSRLQYLESFTPAWVGAARAWLPELGTGALVVDRGWQEGRGLAEVLAESRAIDRRRLVTTRGPHRFDWLPTFEAAPDVTHLSRGQAKLTALAAVLAQAGVFEGQRGESAVLLLDDLPSELDEAHQSRLLETVLATGQQAIITATHPSQAMQSATAEAMMFHVEHGRVSAVRGA